MPTNQDPRVSELAAVLQRLRDTFAQPIFQDGSSEASRDRVRVIALDAAIAALSDAQVGGEAVAWQFRYRMGDVGYFSGWAQAQSADDAERLAASYRASGIDAETRALGVIPTPAALLSGESSAVSNGAAEGGGEGGCERMGCHPAEPDGRGAVRALPKGWKIRLQDDPPFADRLASIIAPSGSEYVVVRCDAPILWGFVQALAALPVARDEVSSAALALVIRDVMRANRGAGKEVELPAKIAIAVAKSINAAPPVAQESGQPDAARYRYLRDHPQACWTTHGGIGGPAMLRVEIPFDGERMAPVSLDAAIDRAIAATHRTEGASDEQ